MFGLIKGRDLLSVKWSRGLHMLVFEPRGNTLVRLTRPTRTHPPRNRRVSNFFGSTGRPSSLRPSSYLVSPRIFLGKSTIAGLLALSFFLSIFVPDFTPLICINTISCSHWIIQNVWNYHHRYVRALPTPFVAPVSRVDWKITSELLSSPSPSRIY